MKKKLLALSVIVSIPPLALLAWNSLRYRVTDRESRKRFDYNKSEFHLPPPLPFQGELFKNFFGDGDLGKEEIKEFSTFSGENNSTLITLKQEKPGDELMPVAIVHYGGLLDQSWTEML